VVTAAVDIFNDTVGDKRSELMYYADGTYMYFMMFFEGKPDMSIYTYGVLMNDGANDDKYDYLLATIDSSGTQYLALYENTQPFGWDTIWNTTDTDYFRSSIIDGQEHVAFAVAYSESFTPVDGYDYFKGITDDDGPRQASTWSRDPTPPATEGDYTKAAAILPREVSAVSLGSINMPKMLRHIKHRTKQVQDLVFIRDPIFRKNVKTRKADIITELAGPPVSFGYTEDSFATQEVIVSGTYPMGNSTVDATYHLDSPPLVIPNVMALQSPIGTGGGTGRGGFVKSGSCKFYLPSFEQLKEANPLFDVPNFTEFEPYDKFIEMDKVIYTHPETTLLSKQNEQIYIPLNSPVISLDDDYSATGNTPIVSYLTQRPQFKSGGISGVEIDRLQFKIKIIGESANLERIAYYGYVLSGERPINPSGSGDQTSQEPFGYGNLYQINASKPDGTDTNGHTFWYNCFHGMSASGLTLPQDEWFTIDVAIPKDVGSKERDSLKENMEIQINTSDKTKLEDEYVVLYDSKTWGTSNTGRGGAASGTGESFCFWFQVDGSQTAPGIKPHFASITVDGALSSGDAVSIFGDSPEVKFIASTLPLPSGDIYNIYFQSFTASTVASEATITITDLTELNNGDKVNLIATDGTSHDFTAGEVAGGGTWVAETNNNTSATNLAAAINANAKFSAAASSAVVTATQATAGIDGNTTVTLTDTGTAGMSKTNFSSPSAIEKTTDALEAAINGADSINTQADIGTYITTRASHTSNLNTIILRGVQPPSSGYEGQWVKSNKYIGTLNVLTGSGAGNYKINKAAEHGDGGRGLSASIGGFGYLGFYGGNNGFNNTVEVDIQGASDDEEIAAILVTAINSQTPFTATIGVAGNPARPTVADVEIVIPNPIAPQITHYVSFGLIDRAVNSDGYVILFRPYGSEGAGRAGGPFINDGLGPFTNENIYITDNNKSLRRLTSFYGQGGFNLARMLATPVEAAWLPGYANRTGLTHLGIQLNAVKTFKIKDLKFYKANEWRIDSIKKYTGEYMVIDAVQIRGGRDSRKRAYGGETRGNSKEFGLHG
jgi:hypothetical protein